MQQVGTAEIETRRLLLRRFTTADAEEMYGNWATDPEVTRWMRWQPHQSVQETRGLLEEWVREYARQDYYHWAIVRKKDGALIGSIGILSAAEPDAPAEYEPGYCIGQAFWGRGYTTEALQAVVAYFFHKAGAKTLSCCHAVGNPASGRVMQKAGFRYLRDGVYHKPDGSEVAAKYYICDTGSAHG